MATCLLALGSNLGDRNENLQAAAQQLQQLPSVDVLAVSRVWANAPVGGPGGQDEFLNAAALIETSLSAQTLLWHTQQIERQQGRTPTQRWDARPLDIDLLLFDDQIINTPELRIPHPWLPVRRFVLEPALQIAADMVHPQLHWSVNLMHQHLSMPQRFVVRSRRFADQLAAVGDAVGAELIADPLAGLEAQPVRNSSQSIKLWRRQYEALKASGWCTSAPTIMSEFWIGPPEWEPPHGVIDDLAAQIDREVRRVPLPKLYIHCNSRDDSTAGLLADPLGEGLPFPCLDLETTDANQFVDEVSSAFVAMR